MAMTAVAVRQASVVDGGKFQRWVMGLLEGGDTQGRANVSLGDLHYDMPDLPVAGEAGKVERWQATSKPK